MPSGRSWVCLAGGRFLLDVASGPVQIAEYVSFSERYEKRICMDISVTGLLHAKKRLGEHAICVIADITALSVVDFAGWVEEKVPPHHANTLRWYEGVSKRPSASA